MNARVTMGLHFVVQETHGVVLYMRDERVEDRNSAVANLATWSPYPARAFRSNDREAFTEPHASAINAGKSVSAPFSRFAKRFRPKRVIWASHTDRCPGRWFTKASSALSSISRQVMISVSDTTSSPLCWRVQWIPLKQEKAAEEYGGGYVSSWIA